MPLQSPLDEKWIACFRDSFAMSGVTEGDLVFVLSESASNPVLVELAELGLARLGARVAGLKHVNTVGHWRTRFARGGGMSLSGTRWPRVCHRCSLACPGRRGSGGP